MATQTDLANRVLQKLRVLGAGQTAAPEDIAVAKQKLRAAHVSFRKDERVRWQIGQLPEEAEEPYVMMAAFLAANDFGKQADPTWVQFAEREINAIVRTPKGGEPVKVEYF